MSPCSPSKADLLKQIWPLILANASVPLLGFTDTFVIGNTQRPDALAALGIAVLLFNLMYWSFGFLRMTSSAQAAQAIGAGDEAEVGRVYIRAVIFALLIGLLLLLFGPRLKTIAFYLFSADSDVEILAQCYFDIRLWSAPATLSIYAASGILIGLGQGRQLLYMQAALAALNALFDVILVWVFNYGIEGIAYGTVVAEYVVMLSVGTIFYHKLKIKALLKNKGSFHLTTWLSIGKANGNLLIRTWFLLIGFFWFIDSSTKFGTEYLAATHLLLQLITFSALVLDAFSYIAESQIGIAVGQKRMAAFNETVKVTSIYAGVSALLLSFTWFIIGPMFLEALSNNAEVVLIAQSYLWLTCIYIFLSFAAFQLDGIYIGANATGALRNNAIISLFVFLGLSLFLVAACGYQGLWYSFIVYVCSRAITLYITRQQLYKLFKP